MPAQKYTHLFFDLDNTIWDFNSNSYEALHATLDKLDLLKIIGSYDLFFKIYSEENDRLWELYRNGLMPKKVLSVQRFEASFEKTGTPLNMGGGVVNDTYLAEMVNQNKLIDGAREVLEYLHGRYEIALITNGFREVQYDKIKRSELSKYFRKVFTSEEIGTPKPGRKIFEYAIKSMNARKKGSLMIGDSWEVDILGAMKFGIDQIYFDPHIIRPASEMVSFSPSNHNCSNIYSDPPLTDTPKPEQNHYTKVNTAFISHLEQLLIIL